LLQLILNEGLVTVLAIPHLQCPLDDMREMIVEKMELTARD